MVELVEIHDVSMVGLFNPTLQFTGMSRACFFFGFGGIRGHDFSDGSLTFLSDSSFLIPG